MASTGTIIYGADYNTVQTKVNQVLGDGYPYGPKYVVYTPTQYSLLPPQYNWAEDQNTLQTTITYNPYGTVFFAGIGTTTTYYDSVSKNTYYRGAFETTQSGATTVNQYAVGLITYYPDFGYNQITSSTSVASSATITHAHWQNLANDTNKVWIHQTGNTYTGYAQLVGKITYANLATIDSYMTTAIANRTTVAASQLVQTLIGSSTNSGSWGGPNGSSNSGTQSTTNISFSSTNATTYFFNQGGNVSFQGIFPTASGSAQDQNWLTFMNSFTYVLNAPQYDILFTATSSTLLLQLSDPLATSAYSKNKVEVWGLPALNTTTVSINVRYIDYHTATGSPTLGPDSVSGGIGFAIYQNVAAGAFGGIVPSSITTTTWTVAST